MLSRQSCHQGSLDIKLSEADVHVDGAPILDPGELQLVRQVTEALVPANTVRRPGRDRQMLPDQAGLDVMRIVVEVHSAGNFIINSEQILSSPSFPQCNGNLKRMRTLSCYLVEYLILPSL